MFKNPVPDTTVLAQIQTYVIEIVLPFSPHNEWRTFVRIHTNVDDNEKQVGSGYVTLLLRRHSSCTGNTYLYNKIYCGSETKTRKIQPNIRAEEHLDVFVQKEPEKEKKWNRINGIVDPEWFSPDPDPALKLVKYGTVTEVTDKY
jgi:hypothetical protein